MRATKCLRVGYFAIEIIFILRNSRVGVSCEILSFFLPQNARFRTVQRAVALIVTVYIFL